MKYLILLLIVFLGYQLWRKSQHEERLKAHFETQKKKAQTIYQQFFKRGQPDAPVEMLPCAVCGLHVPQHQVVRGQRGNYCCQEHKASRE